MNVSYASTRKVPVGVRRIASGAMIAPVFAASVAGPAGSVVHAPNSCTGTPSER